MHDVLEEGAPADDGELTGKTEWCVGIVDQDRKGEGWEEASRAGCYPLWQ